MSVAQFTEYVKLIESMCLQVNSKIDFSNFERHFVQPENT